MHSLPFPKEKRLMSAEKNQGRVMENSIHKAISRIGCSRKQHLVLSFVPGFPVPIEESEKKMQSDKAK